MRTTVTIDADTRILLEDEVRRSGRSFKEVLNASIREALRKPLREPLRVEPLFTEAFPNELEAANFNHLADAWDDEETLRETSR
jgi:hypothetical protein